MNATDRLFVAMDDFETALLAVGDGPFRDAARSRIRAAFNGSLRAEVRKLREDPGSRYADEWREGIVCRVGDLVALAGLGGAALWEAGTALEEAAAAWWVDR